MADKDTTCPCSSGARFADCCEPIINGERESQSAEELMRARYSAFATGLIDFIVASTHSRTRPKIEITNIREWSETSIWRGLQIFDTKLIDDNKAYVAFEALYTQAGKDHSHKEKGEFERENGKWRFVSGKELKNPTVRYETPPTGRNERCPCGSGKKYKRCCGM